MNSRSLIVVLVVLSNISGCAGLQQPPRKDTELANAEMMQQERKFKEAVDIYEKIAKEFSGTERGADALFAAGRVRSLADNPQKEYQRALQNFEEFLRRYPNDPRAEDAQAWRSFLKTILELRKENERLSQSIEQLKRVDIRQEERRRK